MFDSTPLKVPPLQGQNEILHETMLGRLSAIRRAPTIALAQTRRAQVVAAPDSKRMVEVLAVWDEQLEAFTESIDLALSWGPFELVEVLPAYIGADGKQRLLCWFAYHGPLRDRDQFEHYLRESISQVTKIEDASVLAGKSVDSAEVRQP